jgi:hypothetical protein
MILTFENGHTKIYRTNMKLCVTTYQRIPSSSSKDGGLFYRRTIKKNEYGENSH